jgi:enoyl-CoA hydratase
MQYRMADEIEVTAVDAVRVVTLNRPDHQNATNAALHEALALVWGQIAADDGARAVVLTGAGSAFCAGGDLDWLQTLATDHAERRRVLLEARTIVTAMADLHLPIVAAVNGPAVGLGFSIATLCDLVYMAESGFFADPHVVLGLVAADGAAFTLPSLTTLVRAKEYLLLGDRILSSRALELGLVNAVLPDDDVLDAALATASRLAALPPRACQETKRLLNRTLVANVMAAIDYALAAESECFTTVEHGRALSGLSSVTRVSGRQS